ncbi:MAG: cyclic nucleotide-binding domain-containing protein [Rubrivivax sp.]|nr:cyclic nucleotide-binding domain-containing protein [Rubrivivax sp.]
MSPATAHELLHGSVLTTELSEAQCQALAALMTPRQLADGEVLVPEGTADSHLYLLAAGTVAVARAAGTPEEVQLFTLARGDTIGELSFLDDNVHYASVVARGPCTVLGLARSRFESLLDTDPHLLYRVMRAIVRRVHQQQHRLAAQSAELANYVYKQHGRY